MNVVDLFTPDPNKPQAGKPPKPYGWLVIDGGGLAVTAWATHRDLNQAEERVRAAIYVFTTCLASLSKLTAPDAKIVVCWDGKDNRKWRRGYHPWYKHGRGSVINRQEVRVVIQQISALLQCMGIAELKTDGREADDLVAAVSRDAGENSTCLIFSDDKDFIQTVSETVHLCRRSMKGIIMTPDQCSLMDIPWGEKSLHIKAMAGDSGDNIKGLRGIGERKAEEALNDVPDLLTMCEEDPVLADWEDLSKNVRNAIIRAGRKLVWPPKMKDPTFAKKFAHDRGQYPPSDYEVPAEVCLRAAGIQAVKCLRLVELDYDIEYDLQFPDVNIEGIPGALKKLDMLGETDLLSSIYSLARMRDPSLVMPRSPAMRVGAAVDHDADAPPEDMF